MTTLTPDIQLVDLQNHGQTGRTSGYFLKAPRPAIIEVGGVPGAHAWLDALETMHIPRSEIAFVIVTHVHLDHAAGTGTLIQHLPNAKVVVHPRGARHLVDPSRLVEGARSIFGDQLEQIWGIPQPVEESRIIVGEPETYLKLGNGHNLRFFDAPGHAAHQFMILDEENGALFCGDEMGIKYLPLSTKSDYILPITSPNQYNPEAMVKSVDLVVNSLRPTKLLLSHFGPVTMESQQLQERLTEQIRAFTKAGEGVDPTTEEGVGIISQRIFNHVRKDVETLGIDWEHEAAPILTPDLTVSALGVADYWRKRVRGK